MKQEYDAGLLAGRESSALGWLVAAVAVVVLAAPVHRLVADALDQWEERLHAPQWEEEGLVSWYGPGFHGRTTASGEVFDSGELTMAHPSLPFGSQVRVTNLANGREVVVRVNDRGPYIEGRVADLSRAAAEDLGMVRRGVVRARLALVDDADRPG